MMWSGTTRVFVAAIFAAAMFYASLCSTACAAGFCPMLGHGADADQCRQETSGHPDGPRNGIPAPSNCSTHGHPSVFVNAAGPSQYQLTTTAYLSANGLLAPTSDEVIGGSHAPWGTDLAPPTIPKNPLYQQFSTLRI